MFNGTVFVVDPKKNEVLFEKYCKEDDFNLISADKEVAISQKIFKLEGDYFIDGLKKDSVRHNVNFNKNLLSAPAHIEE